MTKNNNVEFRNFTQIKEIRLDEGTNTVTVDGYATTYNSAYPVYGGPERGGWNETIARGSSKKSLSENADVRFLLNHEGLPLARSSKDVHTMTLVEDEIGLYVSSDLDIANPKVQEAASALKRGDVDQMSYAFRVVRDEWSEDRTERTIKEVELVDVSLVTYPANPDTQMKLRNQILEQVEARTSEPAPKSTPNLDKIKELLSSIKN